MKSFPSQNCPEYRNWLLLKSVEPHSKSVANRELGSVTTDFQTGTQVDQGRSLVITGSRDCANERQPGTRSGCADERPLSTGSGYLGMPTRDSSARDSRVSTRDNSARESNVQGTPPPPPRMRRAPLVLLLTFVAFIIWRVWLERDRKVTEL